MHAQDPISYDGRDGHTGRAAGAAFARLAQAGQMIELGFAAVLRQD